ncbi:TetR/AcrR family transcriptional regulator [Aureimonas altamirensis]|uniref:TetR/AcrR family transcriptional regulator n=1 Tax=Aureimonas altamirensis TaxID=370622 RepID=UPI001E5A0E23|nr:TetR/AcrR family transcriptional regulator [Aureimonas altamirensis]UHD45465.1 TetR/AcrR family transcriptional regulator [Aureimonas altamirensis]
MPRPKLHSDEFILDTALSILLQKGPSAFTLSDVAEAVGISRAALIQRFKDKATLHQKVMERNTQEVRDYFASLSVEAGLDPLWAMLKGLIAGMGTGAETEGYLLLLWGDVQNPSLRALAAERNQLVLKAIEARLPAAPHPPELTAGLIQTVIQGACMQWLVEPEGELATFMTERTRMLLSILYPDHVFE